MGGAFRQMDRLQSITPWLDREIRCEGTVGLNPTYTADKDVYLFKVSAIENGQVPADYSLRLEIEGADRTRYQPGDVLRIGWPMGVSALRVQSRGI